jgi:hypothetical protein
MLKIQSKHDSEIRSIKHLATFLEVKANNVNIEHFADVAPSKTASSRTP